MWALATLVHTCGMLMALLACQTQPLAIDTATLDGYANRMALAQRAESEPAPGTTSRERAAPDTGDVVGAERSAADAEFVKRLLHHIPDPEEAKAEAREQLAAATRPSEAEQYQRLLERLRVIERPVQMHLTLQDALRRTLENSYTIRVSSYNPAIEATRVVEAEAAFDAAFFMNITNNKQDQPAINALAGTQIQTFNAEAGLRKLLPTGMQVETSYATQRSSNNFRFQTINPVWFSQFIVQFRQPLLRGFGLDFNRSQIRLSKISRRRVNQQFRRQVRDTLRETEQAYWGLVQARRNLVISAKLLASFEQIYNYLVARQEFDVYRIQLADTKARLERSMSDYIELAANVRNAEDRLIALMNDPRIDLADETEIIPDDLPSHQPLVLDRVAEVQVALENRSEIVEAKLGIEAATIQVGVQKNQALPRFDAVFRYSVDGIGVSDSDAFDGVTKNDFNEYFVGVEFELPVGNRARSAALARAKIQYAQALANLKQVFENVIFDVNVAVRQVQFKFDQIKPRVASADATEDQVASLIARAEKKDFLTLNNELNTRQSLASARSALLSGLLDYGLAITDLERAKGTLLHYNDVDLVFDDADDPAR